VNREINMGSLRHRWILRKTLAVALLIGGLSPTAHADIAKNLIPDHACEDILEFRPQSREWNAAPTINLRDQVGNEQAHFFRGGQDNLTTVQVRAVSGNRPLVGGFFPAGNSGVMMMLDGSFNVQVRLNENSFPVQSGADRGITSHVSASKLKFVNGRYQLDIGSFAFGSVRFLRDHVVADHGDWVEYGMKPDEINERSEITKDGDLVLHRTSLSGKARYTMRLHPLNGAVVENRDTLFEKLMGPMTGAPSKYRFVGGKEDRIDFEITMTSSEPPRVGERAADLVEPWYYAQMSEVERQKLEFLFYEDGPIAGSHAYMTGFGRDPLITEAIAQDAFTVKACKIIAAAQMDTIDDTGNIAHEPEIGERASLTRKQRGEAPDASGKYDETPIYDYSMVDTQFLLMPVMELLAKKAGGAYVREFLKMKSRSPSGRTYGEQLTLNKNRVIEQASAFAIAEMNRPGDIPATENYRHLIHFLKDPKTGRYRATGDWRDSFFGNAGGRTPFGTNAVLVPAALNAILNLYRLGLQGWDVNEVETVRSYHAQWRVKPYHYFRVEIPAKFAKEQGDAYARKLGLIPANVDPFNGEPLVFYGVSLDDEGNAIPLMNSDVSFAMLYTDPPPELLSTMMRILRLPYPYGLDSPAGMFIANPAYTTEEIQNRFTMTAYHAGIWSMQQEMAARGLTRQAARTDLSLALRREIRRTHFQVWRAIVRNSDWRPMELWSAHVVNGSLRRLPFGTGNNIVAESCLNQFWSNTKIANFAPPGWEKISQENLMRFLTWEGRFDLECAAPHQ
jgi:hypothetical protein